MSITFSKDIKIFHPSQFETTIADVPNGKLSIKELEIERTKRLNTDNIAILKSPGNYIFDKKNTEISDKQERYEAKIQSEDSLLTFMYFSKKNVDNIQNVIKYKIYKETGKVIDAQTPSEIIIIMRSIYFEYSCHPPIISDKMDKTLIKKITLMYTEEVERLNQLVIDYIFPNVLSGLQQYICYLADASTMPYQQNQPTSIDNVKGQREYRSITQTLLGSAL